MGHVDHAHDAEGDRKTDRGEQQNRTEADPEDQVLGNPEQRQPVIDVVDGTLRNGTNFRVGLHE